MRYPVTWPLALKHLDISKRAVRTRPYYDDPIETMPAFLTRPEVETLSSKLGFSLPSEEQWECACRGGAIVGWGPTHDRTLLGCMVSSLENGVGTASGHPIKRHLQRMIMPYEVGDLILAVAGFRMGILCVGHANAVEKRHQRPLRRTVCM